MGGLLKRSDIQLGRDVEVLQVTSVPLRFAPARWNGWRSLHSRCRLLDLRTLALIMEFPVAG
jgi:hypothetical protein